jgi:hypothetical protein
MMNKQAPLTTLIGIAMSWEPPVDNRPGKLGLNVDGTIVMLNIWPDNTGVLNGIDMTRIEGMRIQSQARFADERNGEIRYRPSSIKLLEAAPQVATTAPKPAPQSTSTPPSLDQNQMRIMRQSTLHYASILIAPMVKDYATPQLMVERTIELAGILLEYVISGENPYAEAEESSDPDIEQL